MDNEEGRKNLSALVDAVELLKTIHHSTSPGPITVALEITIKHSCEAIDMLSTMLANMEEEVQP